MALLHADTDQDVPIGQRIFGEDVQGYQAARPGYSDAIYNKLAASGALKPGIAMFEIGPGTGQATRRLLDHRPASLVAIEPDERLACHLSGLRTEENVRLHVVHGAFETALLSQGGFDLGVAATSFHWLNEGVAFSRILRLLKPGGYWAMWWNIVHDPIGDAFSRAVLPALYGVELPPSLAPHNHGHYALDVDARFQSLCDAGFADVDHEILTAEREMSAADLRALYATFSMVRRLPAERREAVLDRIEAIAREEFGGTIRRVFRAPIYLARKPG